MLNDQVSMVWYEDTGEFVLYAVEAGETLLLNRIGYKVINWMHLHGSSPASEEQLLEQEETETMECLQGQIQELMQELAKRNLVKRVIV
jgi:hypothetical protein